MPDAAAYFVAIFPALPIIGIFGALGRYLVEEQDEYVRMLMVRQALWASGFALSLATVWGFLENFGLVGHADGYYDRDRLVFWAWCRRRRQQAHARRNGRLLMENRLRVLRAERGWSQQDLAERLEVSRQSVNAIETGKYDPSLPLAFRIAELFDLPIEDIFVCALAATLQGHLTFKLGDYPMLRTCAFILAGLAAATLDWSAPGAGPAARRCRATAGRITIRSLGQGPPVVLIPGLASSAAVCDDVAAKIGPRSPPDLRSGERLCRQRRRQLRRTTTSCPAQSTSLPAGSPPTRSKSRR